MPPVGTLLIRIGQVKGLVFALVAIAIGVAHAQPRLSLKLATGPQDGTYRIVGDALKKVWEESAPPGLSVEIETVSTEGSLDNLDKLKRGVVDLALVQNEMTGEDVKKLKDPSAPPYRGLLILTHQPVQIIAGPAYKAEKLTALTGRPLVLGKKGGGTYATASHILHTLRIESWSEVEASTIDEVKEKLEKGAAHAGFFATTLLSDPAFRLVSLHTDEMKQLQPWYIPFVIPENTYPYLTEPVITISVLTGLLCRHDLKPKTVQHLTRAVVDDVASPESLLRKARPMINLSDILHLTLLPRITVQQHDGAKRAFDTLPFTIRAQPYLQWLSWGMSISLIGVLWATAQFRFLRLKVMLWLAHVLPSVLTAYLRPLLFHRLLWQVILASSILTLIWLAGAAAMYFTEHEVNTTFGNLRLSALSVLVYLFSGLEDRVPVTTEGWLVSVTMLVAGLLIAAYITGQFASEITRHALGVIQMARNTAKDALLVINWNEHTERVLQEFLLAFKGGMPEHSIAVLSEEGVDTARFHEFESQGIAFAVGDIFDKKVLARVGAHEARSVVVIADKRAQDPDAKSALVVLALRSLCQEKSVPSDRRPYICVEVLNHRKMELIKDAGADEVVCHQDYGLGILAQSAFAAKITEVYHELLTYGDDDNEIYILTSPQENSESDIPAEIWDTFFNGKTFTEAAEVFNHHRDRHNPSVLIGIRRGKKVFLNPREQMKLQRGDDLIVISWDRPRLERWQ